MNVRAGIACLLVIAGAPGVAACVAAEPVPVDPAEVIIARVGERDVTLAGFEAYLLASLGDRAEVQAASAVVRSRLLDRFLEAEILVGEALEAGLEVSDEEVRRFLPGNAGDPDRARRVLLERNYTQEVILRDLAVSEAEVRAYYDDHPEQFRRPARVVLRKILTDTAHEARRVRSELIRRPDAFEAIAEDVSLSPDGGRAQAYDEESLPQTFRDMLATVSQGEISPVIEDPQGFYIIRLEERRPERSPSLGEVRDQIELRLLQEKSEKRYREAVRDLRERTRVEILKDRLGFDYIGREAS